MKDFFKIRTPLTEEHGAGEQGTPSLVAKYKNATPGQNGSAPTGQQPARKGDKLNAKFEPVKESTEEEQLDETGGPLGYMGNPEARKREALRRKKELERNSTSAQKRFMDRSVKNVKARSESVEEEATVESIDEDYKQQDEMYRKEAVKHAERVMKAIGSGYISGCKYHARALQDMADEMENTIEYRKNDEKRMKALKTAGMSGY